MLLFLLHFIATLMMTGLIWFVQIVHYPLFAFFDLEEFSVAMRRHQIFTSLIVLPLMLTELTTGVLLLFQAHEREIIRLYGVGVFLIAIIWASTFFLQVPRHRQLTLDQSGGVIGKLVLSNWVRTISWSMRALLLSYLLYEKVLLPSRGFVDHPF